MPQFEKDPSELGALWEKVSTNGSTYLTGDISGVAVVCFAAKPTKSGKGPKWRVLKSQPREERRPAPIDDDSVPF